MHMISPKQWSLREDTELLCLFGFHQIASNAAQNDNANDANDEHAQQHNQDECRLSNSGLLMSYAHPVANDEQKNAWTSHALAQ